MTTAAQPDGWQYLEDDAADLIGYVDRLEELLAEPSTRAPEDQDGGKPRKIAGSPAPWNAAAASLLFGLAADVRRLEAELRMRALGSVKLRSASSENTRLAIRAAADLAPVAARNAPGDDYPRHAARQIHEHARRCRAMLDELRDDEAPWTRAPGGLRCPNPTGGTDTNGEPNRCDRPLWLAPGWQFASAPPVYCRRCKEDDGQPYSWPSGAWLLAVSHQADRQPS